MEQQFPRNSHRPVNPEKPPADEVSEERKLDPVVQGPVIRRKKPLSKRLLKTFFSSDSNSVFGYLAHDVLVPMIKSLVTDLVTQGVEKAVYGEVRSPRGGVRPTSSYRGSAYTSYDRYSTSRQAPPPSSIANRRPVVRDSEYQNDEIVVDTINEAKMILNQMGSTIHRYGVATVADLLNLAGQTADYPDHKFGWMDMNGITYRRVREGYLIVTPEPEDLQD